MIAGIDAAIGHPDMVAFRKSISSAQNLSEMKKVVNPVTQPNGLMEFTRFDLGEVLRKESGCKGSRILRIVAGNPLIMKEMVKQVVDAGSYEVVTKLSCGNGTMTRRLSLTSSGVEIEHSDD